MERVTFLLEGNGARISCLLNPESVLVRRVAGLRPRSWAGQRLTSADSQDDPLLFTGGGTTELELELLFDIGLEGSSTPVSDVRQLTGPLWALSENIEREDGRLRPPAVRFVWGKSWNVPGVVGAVAERLERFDRGGAPARSWLKLRLIRVAPQRPAEADPIAPPAQNSPAAGDDPATVEHSVTGTPGQSGERLEQLAARYYGNPAWWRVLAEVNALDDPHQLAPGQRLRVPPAAALQQQQQSEP